MTTPVQSLLASLGWPSAEIDNKGSLSWQRASSPTADALLTLPPTASLMVAPRVIRAKVLNINPSENIEPHFEAEWSLSASGPPELTKLMYAGQPLPEPERTTANAITIFESLKQLINGSPHLTVLGVRDKSTTPSP